MVHYIIWYYIINDNNGHLLFGLMQGVFMLCKYLPDILTPCQIIQYISVID
jgi:hypothetical protein